MWIWFNFYLTVEQHSFIKTNRCRCRWQFCVRRYQSSLCNLSFENIISSYIRSLKYMAIQAMCKLVHVWHCAVQAKPPIHNKVGSGFPVTVIFLFLIKEKQILQRTPVFFFLRLLW
uniref:Hda110 n=1 Tax=Arundo donax TaxID=35708 RepID=A0A0A9CVH6_ARUDO